MESHRMRCTTARECTVMPPAMPADTRRHPPLPIAEQTVKRDFAAHRGAKQRHCACEINAMHGRLYCSHESKPAIL